MKRRDKTLLLTATIAVAALAFVLIKREKDRQAQMRNSIADEGYETAGDILYPLKSKKRLKMNFGYGN